MEHLKAKNDPELASEIERLRTWIDAQRFHFLTEVNVGNWAETDLRSMAIECGCEDLYRLDYAGWSAGTHSMWHHIQSFNLRPCGNPLHRGGHRVPYAPALPHDLTYAHFAVQYLDDTFMAFDEFRRMSLDTPSARERFESELAELGGEIEARQSTNEPSDS